MSEQSEERTKLSSLKNKKIATIKYGTHLHGQYIGFFSANGKLLFSVRPEDLFDAEGNRFEDDIYD